jgi:hypothetical protein
MSDLARVAGHALGVLRKLEPTTRDDEHVGKGAKTAKKKNKRGQTPLHDATDDTNRLSRCRYKSSSSKFEHDAIIFHNFSYTISIFIPLSLHASHLHQRLLVLVRCQLLNCIVPRRLPLAAYWEQYSRSFLAKRLSNSQKGHKNTKTQGNTGQTAEHARFGPGAGHALGVHRGAAQARTDQARRRSCRKRRRNRKRTTRKGQTPLHDATDDKQGLSRSAATSRVRAISSTTRNAATGTTSEKEISPIRRSAPHLSVLANRFSNSQDDAKWAQMHKKNTKTWGKEMKRAPVHPGPKPTPRRNLGARAL